jgi:hypothetical protein
MTTSRILYSILNFIVCKGVKFIMAIGNNILRLMWMIEESLPSTIENSLHGICYSSVPYMCVATFHHASYKQSYTYE